MSLYNILFGKNPQTDLLLAVIGDVRKITEASNNYSLTERSKIADIIHAALGNGEKK